MNSSTHCLDKSPECGGPVRCQWRCAQEVIDELLSGRSGISGEDADALLDLRWALGKRESAENVLRLFCTVRLRMERRHYLALFRIRRWIENHLAASVRICPAAEPKVVPVRLDHYCVEAVRRACLCAALGGDAILLAPRLEFQFVRIETPARVSPAHTNAPAERELSEAFPPARHAFPTG